MLNRLALVDDRLAEVQFGGNDKHSAVLPHINIFNDNLRANWST